MAFGQYNNLVSNRMREEMYLKHLREVQKINNREAESLKKELKQYHCITDLHRRNKEKSNLRKSASKHSQIERQNDVIHKKILSMSSDHCLKQQTKSTAYNLEKSQFSSEAPSITTRYEKNATLHSRYRKAQQEKIEIQNKKIAKAIQNQKSLLLPCINRKLKSGSNKMNQSQSSLSKNRHDQ